MARKLCLRDLRHTVQIIDRDLAGPLPGSAEAEHETTVLLTPRAKIETRQGTSQWGQVEIEGERVTHRITIRYTPISIDTRHRVRSMTGDLYRILAVENIDERDDWLRLHCKAEGNETQKAAR